ncbi:hybrid sensor histidine kinase/response regulator [Bacteroidia bacterium]|nr:hybrid sensor histidine kinase/response regulator [Bacteroidia bacterium]
MKQLILVFLFIISSFSVWGAENWYSLQVLTTANGLPTDEVRQVYQDKDGYVWIATTDGLCRYDGTQLKTYKANLYKPGLLSSNKITAIAEDNEHNLWIGTGIGLNILNKLTGEIRQIEPKKLLGSNVQAILTTLSGQVWIGTSNGLNLYQPESDSFIHYDNASTNYKLRGNDIKTLIEDSKGNIWIGTWNEGITRYNPSDGVFHDYPRINEGNSAHILFEDDDKNIWVGSWGYGLFRLENPYNPQRVKYINYSHRKGNPNSLSDDIIYSLSQDKNTSAIWVGTRSGLSVLNRIENTTSFTNHLPNHSEESLSYNEINSILCDHSGIMWLGSLGGGVSVVNTRSRPFHLNPLEEVKSVFATNSVRSIYIDKQGFEWLGIGSYGLFTSYPGFRDNPIHATVYQTIQESRTDAYWLATYGEGVYVYDPNSPAGKVKNFRVDSDPWLSNDCVFYLFEDANQIMWMGTLRGLSLYDTKNGKGASFPSLGQTEETGKRYSVVSMAVADDTTVWLATTEAGAFRVTKDDAKHKIEAFTPYTVENDKVNNNHIQVIYKDSKNRVWMGSEGGGLSLFDKEKDAFVSVHQKYNLPGDIIYSMEEDNEGNLFIATNAGLVKIEFLQGSLNNVVSHTYTIADGLQANSFNRNAAFKTGDGILYFGGHKGYNSFDPALMKELKTYAPLVITDIKIFNKSLENVDDKLRKKISVNAPGYTKAIRLPYKYNNFTIEFTSLNYAHTKQDRYAYKLTGFDSEWQYTDASRSFASYNNLKSGTYRFSVKASDESGGWGEQETTLTVVILPPFWLTWWALLLYFILAIAIVYSVIQVARHRISLNNALKVKGLEKEKIEELNHAKLQFFTNITHEFLTPLTILSASVDDLKMTEPQYNEYYEVMSTNINRLIRLLQQILEFRKAETGNLKLKVSNGDIAAFIKSGVDSFKPLMKKNKMHFSLICEPENITGFFDHDKVDKILFNLLSNASKYNKEGGFIQVNVFLDTNNKDIVVISVKDNGEGIKQQDLKGLFKRFYEGDYRRFNTIGTGIGLSLTKDLVTLHKGEITVDSKEGEGTTFFVRLPLNRTAYQEDQIDEYTYVPKVVPANIEENEPVENDEKLKDYSLLLVEDNEELLSLMVKLLGKEYNVFTARNGREGIEVLETEYVDLTISDVMMPVMDGLEFCRYVKNEFELSHVPIILLTAKNTEEDRAEAYDVGADGFISKPFSLNVLHSKIKNLLKKKEQITREFKKSYVYEAKQMNYSGIDEEFLNNAVHCVHEYIADADFDQKQFADAMGISKSTLYKKLKSLTGLNTSLFIRNIRLKTACQVISEKKKIRISELAYSVGFNDPKYFSACFKKEFGLIPSEYLDEVLAQEQTNIDNA